MKPRRRIAGVFCSTRQTCSQDLAQPQVSSAVVRNILRLSQTYLVPTQARRYTWKPVAAPQNVCALDGANTCRLTYSCDQASMRCDARTVSSSRPGLEKTKLASNSQIIERQQFRNTAKDHKHGNGEVHHATVFPLASFLFSSHKQPKLLPSFNGTTHKISEKSMAGELARCGNRSLTIGEEKVWMGSGRNGHLLNEDCVNWVLVAQEGAGKWLG